MALPDQDCAYDTDVCCDQAYGIASNILNVAYAAVAACEPNQDCPTEELKGYVTVGTRMADPVPDYLAVALSSLAPAPPPPKSAGRMFVPTLRASFQVRLLEKGWPEPWGDESTIIMPEPDRYDIAALHSYSHGEAMYRALLVALMGGELTPGSPSCYKSISPLTPVDPSGGAVGWTTSITVGFDLAQ